MMPLAIFFIVIAAAMLGETVLSARHERVLRAAGAVEPREDVIGWMQIAYPASFIVMVVEGFSRGVRVDAAFAVGVAVFAVAKALKYWAMASLGGRWTFRVLVPPRSSLTSRGPYRWMRHPNYIGVAGELAGTALVSHAAIAGPIAVAVFAVLLWRRVQIEENALAARR